MKRKLFYFLSFCLLIACTDNKPKEVATDTTAAITPDTAKTVVMSAEDSAKLSNQEFEKIFSRSVQILKSGKLKDLSEVIDPESGLFILFNGGGPYSSYQVFPDMNYIDTLGEDDRAVSRLSDFANTIGKAKDNVLVIQYADDVKDTSPCTFKRRGTFAIDLIKPQIILSGLYQTVQQMVGDDADPAEVKKLKAIEKKLNRVVIMNVFKDGDQPYPETLYFTKQDGKWYLIGIDTIDCFSA